VRTIFGSSAWRSSIITRRSAVFRRGDSIIGPPPAYVDGRPLSGNKQGAGWGFQILPYIEERTTWKGAGGGTDQELSIKAIGAVSPVFFCPSRRGPQTVTYSDPFYLGGLELKHALCDYAGSNFEGTGAVRQYRGVAIREITDGTSKTFLVGDKRLNVRLIGQWQEDDNEGYSAGWDEDTIRYTNVPPAPDPAGGGSGDNLFGSSHHGGLNMSFADGSVHRIDFSIDAKTFEYLGNKNDGNGVDATKF
jgi:prepilin-type processing-associated H-X9-DG protein